MSAPHDTSPPRLRQIAESLSLEGWHTWAGTIDQVATEIERRDHLLRKIRAHTGLPPYPTPDLLLGLLSSIVRILNEDERS